MLFSSLNDEWSDIGISEGRLESKATTSMEVARRLYSYMAANEDSITMSEALKLISPRERKAIIDEENSKGVKSFMNKHQDLFTVSGERAGGPDTVKAVVDIEFCKVFDSKQGCEDKACEKLHVCRHFVKGKCTFGSKCKKPHQFNDAHTQEVLKRHFLDGLTHSHLKDFLCRNVQFALDDSVDESSLPKQLEICKYYNVAIGCSREEHCPFLHICRFFAEEGLCKFGQKCIRKHDFSSSHSCKLLSRYRTDEQKALAFLRKKLGQCQQTIDEEILTDSNHKMTKKPDPRAFFNITNLKSEVKKPRARSFDIAEEARSCESSKLAIRKTSEPANRPQSNDEVYICANYILGACLNPCCSKVHHKLPFLWQYSNDGKSWTDLDESGNIKVEASFIDVGKEDVVVLLEDKHKFVFKFSQLVGIQQNEVLQTGREARNAPPVIVQIRRLSTPPALNKIYCNDIAYTTWNWCYLDDLNYWKSYNEDYMSLGAVPSPLVNNTAIEIAFSDPRRKSFQFRRGANTFVIDFDKFTQENFDTKKTTLVRRRPAPFNHCLQPTNSEKRIKEELLPEKSFYPSCWIKDSLQKPHQQSCRNESQCELIQLDEKSTEYKSLSVDLKRSFGNVHISKIMAVHNNDLWQTYSFRKNENQEELRSSKIEERLLYRAATWENAKKICKYGFEVDSSLGQQFSNAKYFARDARLANRKNIPNEAGLFVMFLCRVLTNSCVTARLGQREALLEGYKSLDDLSMYFVFDSDQIYPEFVLLFEIGNIM